MRTAEFDFELPPELIAQAPPPQRDQSRLLVLDRSTGQLDHRQFRDLPGYLRPGDVLVLNNSRVIPARLRGTNAKTGGQFEVLLLEENNLNDWWVMLRPGKRARVGTRIQFRAPSGQPSPVDAIVLESNSEGHRRLRFEIASLPGAHAASDIKMRLDELGEVPLPPYINRSGAGQMEQDRQRYQTVFARPPGSVAAPTAGLHFTEALLDQIRAAGVRVCFLTLHVGLGTFAPVKSETIEGHLMHAEHFELSQDTADAINAAKQARHRVVAVGTTTVRVLESLGAAAGSDPQSSPAPLSAHSGRTRIFIYPPYRFRIVDALLTNFHLPRSTLLMLVSAFADQRGRPGRELVLAAYAEAVRQRYRFFSYGDAMLFL
jgi:S-adenosylmethionine:tRNA ribosyltransferase-isomerase